MFFVVKIGVFKERIVSVEADYQLKFSIFSNAG